MSQSIATRRKMIYEKVKSMRRLSKDELLVTYRAYPTVHNFGRRGKCILTGIVDKDRLARKHEELFIANRILSLFPPLTKDKK